MDLSLIGDEFINLMRGIKYSIFPLFAKVRSTLLDYTGRPPHAACAIRSRLFQSLSLFCMHANAELAMHLFTLSEGLSSTSLNCVI